MTDENRAGRRRALMIGAATLAALPAAAQEQKVTPAETAQLNLMALRANAGTVGIVTGAADGTYVRIASDLAAVLDGERLRVNPILGRGSLQNIADIMLLRSVDLGIVQTDALAHARRQQMFPSLDRLIHYVCKLYDEEVHLLARPGIASVHDLAGQRVNIDQPGSGTAVTAGLILEALGIPVEAMHDPQDVALERLRRGEIAALVYVAGKPARLFTGIRPEEGLRLLPLPAAPALLETYLPTALTAADYPALLPEAGVETLAVGAALVAHAWQPNSERHRKVARFVQALTQNFDAFLRPPRHPKWREVNLAATVPGWSRSAAAP